MSTIDGLPPPAFALRVLLSLSVTVVVAVGAYVVIRFLVGAFAYA
jgi:hypothetical protein